MLRAVGVLWILSALVCVGRGHHHEGHGSSDQTDQHTTVPSSTNTVSLVKSANKDFALRLYTNLANHADSQGKNIFFSPVSVSVALAALSVGARGETHEQLFTGLGFNSSLLTQTDVDQAFHSLLNNNGSQEDASQGTAVFVDDQFKTQPEFLDVLKQSYFADGFTVDFNQSTESANTINRYVEEKTHGKIDKMVESLDEDTVMYLLSYIYYKGKWASQFDPQLTKEDEFTVNENTKVSVQMMNKEDGFDTSYDREINTNVLHLHFTNSYSMLLLLPDDMATLERVISPSHVHKWLNERFSQEINIFIPKFSIKTSYSLKDVLRQMGMTDMFSHQADLSGISERQKLFVSEVVHQASLDIDEVGGSAAAATGAVFHFLSYPPYIPVLKFDRPFMVLIIERNTADILFMGKITNPTI
ncbi:alpha-1-antitrypsin-like protein CM55-MS [Sphaeramia orbicularis]|uniref:Thyroxine-binding globulin n=1 Tax=Sphaeramia orbicularis TaxID=375764 RepID=A0A672Y5B5_9TELE|nr:alpha-1-antitrypsin-like protein CM55-MS [Sphaeramia orbicularis]